METYNEKEIVNIGCGADISIKELAEEQEKLQYYKGNLVFDTSRPDGTPRKLLDVSKYINLKWQFIQPP